MPDADAARGGGVAALSMYDWPEMRAATDAFWAGWRDHLRAEGMPAPDALERERPIDEVWRDPALIASQTCGAPYVQKLGDAVQLVATPCYAAEGCDGPTYVSWIVCRDDGAARDLDDIADSRVAVNGYGSFSGWIALCDAAPTPRDVLLTGSHRASALAVASGEAAFAAIDCVSWRLFTLAEPEAARRLRRLAATRPAPGLPFVTAIGRDAAERDAIRRALDAAMAEPALAEARAAIGLRGVERVAPETYRAVVRSRSVRT